MKRFLLRSGGVVLGLLAIFVMVQGRIDGALARSRYGEDRVEKDSFDSSVDLKRFRKGNERWDTQELVVSGLKALHKDHRQIMDRLKNLESKLRWLEEEER